MAHGTHTTVEHLSCKLLQRWVPKWYEAFADNTLGGFYERMGHGFQPILTGQRRLLTQCRQLALYAHAVAQTENPSFAPDLKGVFDYIVATYYVPQTGAWRFSVDDEGKPLDNSYDLYALAFVIFALSHYYRATQDEKAHALAVETIAFIDKNFRTGVMPGLVEALDEHLVPMDNVRRHESHMHFLEACLFAAETWDESAFMRMADEMVGLFMQYFYKPETGFLSEYYTDMFVPQPNEDGRIVAEPGHYCEWIWLLKKHAALKDDPAVYDDLCWGLLQWANRYGWDEKYGGIYDELTPEGEMIADTKRIWPFTEALKANALMLDYVDDPDKSALKKRVADMVAVFNARYMHERGFWMEWLQRDLTAVTDYMPATTPYHVYFGIMEARGVLAGRGVSKSLALRPLVFLYALRRRLSALVKRLVKAG